MKSLYLPRFLRVLLLVSMFTIAGCGSTDEADPPSRDSPAEVPAEAPTAQIPDADRDVAADEVHVLVLGNSIAAGLGLDPDESFPALLQDRAEARGWPVQVTNAGVSGDTSAGGLSRLDWLLDERVDILIIELGGNDGLRGLDPNVTQQNLGQIIETARGKQPDIEIILGTMQIPPNMGQDYTEKFRGIYRDVADAYDVPLVPIVPEDLASVSDYIQDDGIHPTAEGQEIIASNVWETLGPMLEAAVEERTAAVAE
ncbi:MAG: arylesterase [Bacteroidetes bacterium]|jgi:acyl-CoA thioesterase-1|nr:arylesterase [Bacteroidota bacterium]